MDKQNSRKTIRTFAWASFFNDMGSDMIYPIWPLFVTTVLGAPMSVLGFIDGLGEAVVSVSQAVSGYLSDHWRKRKIFIVLGYLFGSLSRVGYAFSSIWQHLIPLKILDRAGKSRGAPRDAVIADLSTQNDRGRNFGLLRAVDNLGAVCGILICIFLFNTAGYRHFFLWAAIPSAISVLLIMLFIKEGQTLRAKIYNRLSFKNLDSNFRLFLAASSVSALGLFSYSFLLIYARDNGFQIGYVPVLYLIFSAVASLFSMPFGTLADKIGRKPVLIASNIFWGIVCAIFIYFSNRYAVIVAFIFFGLHRAAVEPVQKTLVSELAPTDYRASYLGAFQMVIGLCAFPASFIAGILWDKFGIQAPFRLSIGFTVISTVMLLFVKEKTSEN